jgi:hypothetical protein
MRTARTIGIKEDGSESVIHPKSTCVTIQEADFQKFAAGRIPSGFVVIEFQKSDGPCRTLRATEMVSLKEAISRAEEKQKAASAKPTSTKKQSQP